MAAAAGASAPAGTNAGTSSFPTTPSLAGASVSLPPPAGQTTPPAGQPASASTGENPSYPSGESGGPTYSSGESGGYGQPPEKELDPEVLEDRKKIEELQAVRTWTDSSGQHKFEGKFMDFAGGKVTLQRASSEDTITLDMGQLSAADQKFIRDGLRAQTAERKREELAKKSNLRRPRNNSYSN
jgi:hypothetical protein